MLPKLCSLCLSAKFSDEDFHFAGASTIISVVRLQLEERMELREPVGCTVLVEEGALAGATGRYVSGARALRCRQLAKANIWQ